MTQRDPKPKGAVPRGAGKASGPRKGGDPTVPDALKIGLPGFSLAGPVHPRLPALSSGMLSAAFKMERPGSMDLAPTLAPSNYVILLPPRGLRARRREGATAAADFLSSLHQLRTEDGFRTATAATVPYLRDRPHLTLNVIDSISEDGAKLVEISPAELSDLRAVAPGIRAVPLRYYEPQTQRMTLHAVFDPGAHTGFAIAVDVSGPDGAPVPDAQVYAFTHFATRLGSSGRTGPDGRATLIVPDGVTVFDRVYVFADRGYWGAYRQLVPVAPSLAFTLLPVSLDYRDVLSHFFPAAPDDAGTGVQVAVVDSGVGPHPDLVVAGGRNTVPGESPGAFGDNGLHHGTHVAGIIAGRGRRPHGMRGLAPAAELWSYRVFREGERRASNYSIAKAIDQATTTHGCHIVNLSLGGQIDPLHPDPDDELLAAAIADAHDAGAICVVAAGNDHRRGVAFPGRAPLAIAVGAMGRVGTFPTDSTEAAEVAEPYGAAPADFVAAFSNYGPEIDVTGPGVGVISCVPPQGYTPMSGTSMAAPVVSALAARILAAQPGLRDAQATADRAVELTRILYSTARRLGFGALYEGQGMPQ
jgi:subtilisin